MNAFDPLAPLPISLFQEPVMSHVTTPYRRPRSDAHLAPRPRRIRRLAAGLATLLLRFVDLVQACQQRGRERRQLDYLGDHMMKDIGISRADIEREVSKPAWRE
jgi:uncharacterized protein YjiS (DUF1127 family)